MANQGTFIVLEGADGSGKGTQFRLLHERLKAVGYDVVVFDFPRYSQPSSYFVKRYLNGEYGPASSVSPYTASLFYALDRYEATPQIKKALEAGKIVLCNRYVGSNMAHMGAKIDDPIEQRSFFVWEDSLEFQLLDLPRPNLNIFLHVPAAVSYELIAKKSGREYTSKNRDEHEADMEHLKKAVSTYELLCQLFPTDFVAVDCVIGNKLLDIPEINNRIWQIIKPLLPPKPSGKGHKVTLKLSETGEPKTEAEKEQTIEKSPKHSDLGLVSLDLLTQIKGHMPESVDFNLDWSASGYKYLVPAGLNRKTAAQYKNFMDELVNVAKKPIDKRPTLRSSLLPASAQLRAKFSLNAENASKLSEFLNSVGTIEAAMLAKNLTGKQKDGAPQTSSGGGQPERLGNIISKITKNNADSNLSGETDTIRLFQAIPKNEFSLLADIVYPYSEQSLGEIEVNIEGWSYQQKYETLRAAILDKAKALGEVRYRFDIVADRIEIKKLLDSGASKEITIQTASPRFGYDVPADLSIEAETKMLDLYDKSLALYSQLQSASPRYASLATLAGHRLRAHVVINLPELIDKKMVPEKLRAQLVEIVGEAHPIIASSIAAEPSPKRSKSTSKSKKS